MSKELETKTLIDMTEHDEKSLRDFKEAGLPGIVSVTDEQVKAIIEMYVGGASYGEISSKLNIKKGAVLFLAEKHNLLELKTDLYKDMTNKLKEKIDITSLRGVDFMNDMMSSVESYYRDIIKNYKVSKNKNIMESLDLEMFKIYLKCLEQIEKYKNPPKEGDNKRPLGVHLPLGGSATRLDDNNIVVTPPISQAVDAKIGDALRYLASLREMREQTNKKEKQ